MWLIRIMSVTHNTGNSLKTSQLYERLLLSQKRNEGLVRILKAASSDGDVGSIVDDVMEAVHDMLRADRVILYLSDELTSDLWCR